jgi:hypothetical protein
MRGYLYGFCAALLMIPAIASANPPQASSSAQQAQSARKTPVKPESGVVRSQAAPAAQIPPAAEESAVKLPVRRVVLYKSGVGYFEHLGEVHGDQTVAIDFTSGQLNDVLQSLTVLDLNGGRITGVDYNSRAPLSQRLGTLRLPLGEKTNLAEFLTALRGARVEIRSGDTAITGRILSVERKTRVSGGTTLEVDLATIVSDSGDVRSVEITPAVTVRMAEKDVTDEVSRYLSLLASERQQDLRRMTISTAGAGDRQLYVSYISEVPIWKTTYRVVLPTKPGDEPLLQGWAIVDNTVGEDWNDVELSLVAGAPQSFIEQLSQPYYARRPVVPLPQSVQLSPQTHESAMLGGFSNLSGIVTDPSGAVVPNAEVKLLNADGTVAATTRTDNQGHYQFSDMPAAAYRAVFSMPGFRTAAIQGISLGGGRDQSQNVTLQIGATTETVEVTATPQGVETESASIAGSAGTVGSGNELGQPPASRLSLYAKLASPPAAPAPPPMPAEDILAQARQQTEAAAKGADLGDLFEYKLKDHVTIHKNESALVPIVNVHVAAEKVSLWNSSLNSPRPLRALWLTNSSPLTLDGGSFTVLENETFAGEGLTDPIKPGEKRLLSYAADLGVRVDAKSESQPQRVTRVRIYRGVMTQTRELRQNTTYTVRDDDTTPRTILIEHPLRVGWKLADSAPKPAETTSSVYRFRLAVDPKSAEKLDISESEPLETRYEISNLTGDQITLFLQQKSINPEVEAALRKIIAQKNVVAGLEDQISERDDEKQKIYDDQQRIRENLKALKGSPAERALTLRYTQQLSDQETRLQVIAKETADLQARQDAAQNQLDNMIQNLSLDTTL